MELLRRKHEAMELFRPMHEAMELFRPMHEAMELLRYDERRKLDQIHSLISTVLRLGQTR